MSFYPAKDLGDAGGYTVGLVKLFTAYPEALVRRLVDPADGIASESPYFPSIADCSVWLKRVADQLKARQGRYRIPDYSHLRPMTEAERLAYESKAIPPPRIEPPREHEAKRTDFRGEYAAMLAAEEASGTAEIPANLRTPWLEGKQSGESQ